jgi:DNA-directed RNA polymerase specialized sigma24 family protein
LIDHARKPRAPCVPLDEVLDWFHSEQRLDLLDLKIALDELEKIHPRHYGVVMQKVFAGRGTGDIARDEKCSKSTIEKDWAFARGWLRKRLKDGTDES